MKRILLFILLIVLVLSCGAAYGATSVEGTALPNEVYNLVVQNAVVIIGILGVLAFAVELVVQLTKDLRFIKSIPTQLYVIIISLIVCELSLFIYAAYGKIIVLWYYIVLAAFMGFVVAYISMYGWDTLRNLYSRYTSVAGGMKDEVKD